MNAVYANGAFSSTSLSPKRRFIPLLVLACSLITGVFFLPPFAVASTSKKSPVKVAAKAPVQTGNTSRAASGKSVAQKKAPPKKQRSKKLYVKSLMPQEDRAALRDRGISSGFGLRAVSKRATRPHKGIDIPAPKNSEIMAFNDGEVVFTGRKNGYGIMVLIKQIDGREALYAHMNSAAVNVGDRIKRGDHLGFVGRTGRATGYHLHFELIDEHKNIDPALHVWHGSELVFGPGDLNPDPQGQTRVAEQLILIPNAPVF